MADRPELDSEAENVLDALAQELYEAKRFAAQLAIERQHLSDSVDTMRAREREAAQADIAPLLDAARRARDTAIAERNVAFVERDLARADAHDAAAMLHRVTSSTAWRATGPVRRLLQALLRR